MSMKKRFGFGGVRGNEFSGSRDGGASNDRGGVNSADAVPGVDAVQGGGGVPLPTQIPAAALGGGGVPLPTQIPAAALGGGGVPLPTQIPTAALQLKPTASPRMGGRGSAFSPITPRRQSGKFTNNENGGGIFRSGGRNRGSVDSGSRGSVDSGSFDGGSGSGGSGSSGQGVRGSGGGGSTASATASLRVAESSSEEVSPNTAKKRLVRSRDLTIENNNSNNNNLPIDNSNSINYLPRDDDDDDDNDTLSNRHKNTGIIDLFLEKNGKNGKNSKTRNQNENNNHTTKVTDLETVTDFSKENAPTTTTIRPATTTTTNTKTSLKNTKELDQIPVEIREATNSAPQKLRSSSIVVAPKALGTSTDSTTLEKSLTTTATTAPTIITTTTAPKAVNSQIFKNADVDGDGFLDHKEINSACGGDLTEEDIKGVFQVKIIWSYPSKIHPMNHSIHFSFLSTFRDVPLHKFPSVHHSVRRSVGWPS